MNWDKWLQDMEQGLVESGYRKYFQNYKNEDFAYWKPISVNGKKAYQVGLLFYDFRKYIDRDPAANKISIQYQCMILCDDRIDLSVSKDITVKDFEAIAHEFYNSMKQFT